DVKSSKVEKKSVKEPMVVKPAFDFRLQFMTARKFTTQQEMQQWFCAEAEMLGFIVVVAKSDNGGNSRKAYVLMGCHKVANIGRTSTRNRSNNNFKM
ncbi:FAR1-related protein, partial [Trifolium medium]|nr:FAR1-related protein [Trifolium medium]